MLLAASQAGYYHHHLATLIYLLKLPKASALDDTAFSNNPTPASRDDSVSDYIAYGIVILYMIVTRCIGSRAKAYSLVMMLATAFL